jgi:hypothetical protein
MTRDRPNLNSMLAPESIAVIGASEKPGSDVISLHCPFTPENIAATTIENITRFEQGQALGNHLTG